MALNEVGANNTFQGNTSGASAQTQVINGKTYRMYTPEWQTAVQDEKVRQAGIGGTAAGTAAGNALKSLNEIYPGATNPSTSTSTSSSSAYPSIQFPPGFGPGGTGGNMPPQVQFNAPSFEAAQTAAWNRAKDLTGQTANAAMTGLRSSLGGRGLLGSGIEGKGTARVMNAGQQQLGDVSRQQAIDSANQAQKNAELEFTGGISQRGQDLSSQQAANALAAQLAEAQYGGQVTMRGQDISSANAQRNSQTSLIDRILGALQGYGAY